MSRPKNVSNHKLFNHDAGYVITPTYETREELDEHIQLLHQKAKQRGYSENRVPQRVFLQILGVRQPIGSDEYMNDVLLDTGVRHMVRDKHNRPKYWYMQFTTDKNESNFKDRTDLVRRHDLNSWTG